MLLILIILILILPFIQLAVVIFLIFVLNFILNIMYGLELLTTYRYQKEIQYPQFFWQTIWQIKVISHQNLFIKFQKEF